ncbi:MAG: hypothetical protein HY852_27150 [Bradyrhizobium sp.]|uniref:hypothetical protein n=1 Tax=Bradyrhizobium sp. TaxID=376 RepID=UPI0025C1296F|nr:hypothetical protein [Bradyrhizobium sp.]MBI5265488.1 hypothetical protein [Bradyrhizobium sp.]
MARVSVSHIPTQNPCAQCGSPIALPEWTEAGEGRVSYLWHCRACNYRFEAIAIYEQSDTESRPLAA